jgi:endonuclease III
MTRAVLALQMLDMFNYNYFVNATLEDMKRMQYLLLYVGMNKARERPATMIGTCRIIDSIFNGRLPDTIEDWMGFHNVARKLAALIMNDALGFVYFLVVDTHLKQVLPKIGWTDKTNADDIAIDIEDWLDRMLLKETNEMIVGIRQLYKYSTKSEKTIIIQFINMYSKTKHSDLLVGLL